MKTPIEKQELPETCSFDSLQKLLRNDLIGIDVSAIHGRDNTGMFCKCSHNDFQFSRMTRFCNHACIGPDPKSSNSNREYR